jgi:ATP-dependent DNA helicase RecG
MTVENKLREGADYIVLTVQPSKSTPVRCKEVVWVRTGSSTHRAGPEEERRLVEKRRGRDLPFDVQENASASEDDLHLDLFEKEYLTRAVDEETLLKNSRSRRDQMKALHFMGVENERPTHLALLMIGKEPTFFIPGAYVLFLRIDGVGLGDPIKDSKELRGPLIESLTTLDELLKINISTAIDVKSASVEIATPDYPLAALQQLVRNAVLHRDYQGSNAPVRILWFTDRIEIHSPGGPFGHLTAENFGQPGFVEYRNPNLAHAMRTLGFVQRFGIGITIARDECRKNGNPEPEFPVEPMRNGFVLAIVRKRS